MSKKCPLTNEPVLYLDCLDCDDRQTCRSDNISSLPYFLYFDIDGVLNTENEWKRGNGLLNEKNVENFCKLVKELRLTPIITSSWRAGFIKEDDPGNSPQIRNLEEKLKKHGIYIAGKTPETKDHTRNEEIKYHLKRNPNSGYIILDDDESEYEYIDEHNYFTESKKGLIEEDIKKIIKESKGHI